MQSVRLLVLSYVVTADSGTGGGDLAGKRGVAVWRLPSAPAPGGLFTAVIPLPPPPPSTPQPSYPTNPTTASCPRCVTANYHTTSSTPGVHRVANSQFGSAGIILHPPLLYK